VVSLDGYDPVCQIFWWEYTTKLELISSRKATDLPRAARVVMRTFCVRIGVRGSSKRLPRLRYRSGAHPKFLLFLFFVEKECLSILSPSPRPLRRKAEMVVEKFRVLDASPYKMSLLVL
jgi:hypothetical protein